MGLKIEQASGVDKIVGANLRQIRTSHRMSHTALAEKIGISFQQIQNRFPANTEI
jgi:transcriptional regulator with XRE-family HTH domain